MIPTAEKVRIIRLARSGSLERASTLLEAVAERTGAHKHPAYLTIKGRLTKDRAKRAKGEQAAQLFAMSADLYEKAARDGAASYPLINAASMSLLSGDPVRTERLALRILEILEANPKDAETPYWLWATRAESYLLTGQSDAAQNALDCAMGFAPDAREDHAATVGQLHRICEQLGFDTAWLDPYRPPATLSFALTQGLSHDSGKAIASALEQASIGYAFGSLQSPSDVMVADELIGKDIDLHVVLASDPSTHIRLITQEFGDEWGERCGAILELCETTVVGSPETLALAIAPAAVVGAALQNANMLQASALHLVRQDAETHNFVLAEAGSLSPGDLLPQRGATSLVKDLGVEGPEQIIHAKDMHAGLLKALEFRSRGMAVAIDFAAADNAQNRRLSAIAELAEAGSIYCSIEFAYCARATCEDCPIQHIGDVRSAIGSFPLYAIA